MKPTLCSRCKKNLAVIFITKIDGGKTVNEGLCLKCAKEMGIKPVDDMIERMGLSEDDLENLNGEMTEAMNGLEGLLGQNQSDDDEADENDSQTATFPFLNKLFGAAGQDNVPAAPEPEKTESRQRAAENGALLLRASATPSTESYFAAQKGRTQLVRLTKRYGGNPLPSVQIVDMRAELASGNPREISLALEDTIRRNLEAQTEVKVVNDRKEAEAIFELLGQSRGSNVLAYNTDGRARIYSLRLTNTFRVVLQNGVELLPTTTVSATRELIRDESDENGRANQERLLYEEMEQSCIHQMVSRMTHISEEAVRKGMHELE